MIQLVYLSMSSDLFNKNPEEEIDDILETANTFRAYPKTSAFLNAIIAKAKWHKAS